MLQTFTRTNRTSLYFNLWSAGSHSSSFKLITSFHFFIFYFFLKKIITLTSRGSHKTQPLLQRTLQLIAASIQALPPLCVVVVEWSSHIYMVDANRTEVASLSSTLLCSALCFDSKQTNGLSGGGLKKEEIKAEEACGWWSSLQVQVHSIYLRKSEFVAMTSHSN